MRLGAIWNSIRLAMFTLAAASLVYPAAELVATYAGESAGQAVWVPAVAVWTASGLVALAGVCLCLWGLVKAQDAPSAEAVAAKLIALLRAGRWVAVGLIACAGAACLAMVRPLGTASLSTGFAVVVALQVLIALHLAVRFMRKALG
jgi:hypothetical protein